MKRKLSEWIDASIEKGFIDQGHVSHHTGAIAPKNRTIKDKIQNSPHEKLSEALSNDEIAYLLLMQDYAMEFSKKAARLNEYLQETDKKADTVEEWGKDVVTIAISRLERYHAEFELLNKQAKESIKYKNVIKHLENAFLDMSDDETIGQDEWLGGWAAAIDFIEENIDWEETDEAKTIVEENKELSDRVQELEEMEELLNEYYENIDDPFASTDNAMAIVDKVSYFVNRVQELEERNKFLEKAHRINVNIAENMKEERNRYREVLEFYARKYNYAYNKWDDRFPNVNIDDGKIARKALEGEG